MPSPQADERLAGIWEMTWEREDGRATFMYGSWRQRGGPVIIWRRIGGHEIFDQP